MSSCVPQDVDYSNKENYPDVEIGDLNIQTNRKLRIDNRTASDPERAFDDVLSSSSLSQSHVSEETQQQLHLDQHDIPTPNSLRYLQVNLMYRQVWFVLSYPNIMNGLIAETFTAIFFSAAYKILCGRARSIKYELKSV